MEEVNIKSAILGFIVLLIVFGGIFLLYQTQKKSDAKSLTSKPANPASPPKSTSVLSATSPKNTSSQITVPLNEQNGSGESGNAIFKEVNGNVRISIMLNGAPPDLSQPAHIHFGSCQNPGDILYPLTPPLNGKSETTLSLNLQQLKNQLPLAVNVHKSQDEQGIYVACGDINIP